MRDITPARIAANNEEAARILAEQGIETDDVYPLSVQMHNSGKWQVVDLRTLHWYDTLHEKYEAADAQARQIKQAEKLGGKNLWQK